MKTFKCMPFHSTPLLMKCNRMGAKAKITNGSNLPESVEFLLDTGAIISIMSQTTAEDITTISIDRVGHRIDMRCVFSGCRWF